MKEEKPNCTGWILIANTQPKVISSMIPIYWTKVLAIEAQRLYGGTVKKVNLFY